MANTANTRSKTDKWNEKQNVMIKYMSQLYQKFEYGLNNFISLNVLIWSGHTKTFNDFISQNSVSSMLFFSVGIGSIFLIFDFCCEEKRQEVIIYFI